MKNSIVRSNKNELLHSISYVLNRFVLQRKYLTTPSVYFGSRFRIRIEDAIGRALCKHGVHEKENTEFLLENLIIGEDDIIIDIGANLGWFSVLLDKIAPRSATIHAFEPEPSNFELLQHNLELNNSSTVIPHQVGISDTPETKTLYLYPQKNRGRHSLRYDPELKPVEINVVVLNEYLSEKDKKRVRFIKIDIEGFELPALQGASELLDCKPDVLMEFSPGLYDSEATKQAILNLFYSRGYRSFRISSNLLEEISKDELDQSNNQFDIFWRCDA